MTYSFILVPESIEQMTLNFFQKSVNECLEILIIIIVIKYRPCIQLLSDFINLTQVHNFTVSAQDNFTFRRLSVFSLPKVN